MSGLKCSVCGGVASKLCSGCGSVGYCSREHQKDDWKKYVYHVDRLMYN